MSWDAWQVGADAARAGEPPTSCPYPATSYDMVTWYHGYAWALHDDARKAERTNTTTPAGNWEKFGRAFVETFPGRPRRRVRIKDE